MIFIGRITSLLFFFGVIFFAENSLALPGFKSGKDSNLPAILKADVVNGDQINQTMVATGNVELSKGSSVVYADQMTYDKNGGVVRAIGNVKIKNIEIGNVKAVSAEIKDDFSSGKFLESQIVFADGSYLTSPEVHRETPLVTVLQKPVYSICPNPEISANNELAGVKRDFFSIKSSKTTIDKDRQIMRSRGGIFRFYNVPFFYTPFIQTPLPAKKRQSGFLHPSYYKTTNLGIGLKIPYYFNIAPNMDLTTTPNIGIGGDQFLIANEFRHMPSYGEYHTNFEIANNKITNTANGTVAKRTEVEYRWALNSAGIFDFTKNTGLDFSLNTVGDRNYLRDYHGSYLNYNLSRLNVDYIHGRSYHAIKTIKIQELENADAQRAAPFILPMIDSHIETKPFFFKEKLALTSNATVITREDGLQYRRTTFIPEVNVPFNLHGNLFNIIGKVQNDFYSLDNNFQFTQRTNDYDKTQYNYKPEGSLSWRLPMIRKKNKSTLLVEPMINFVSSSYKKNFNKLPNEDSNNAELSMSNLFVNDRISGFDRNEAGERLSYGVKSSLFNRFGELGLTVGQSYKRSGGLEQDTTIRGFSDSNKSNIVGQMMYRAVKYFSISYAFQLDESNYRNDVNQVSTSLAFDRITFSSNFLLLRKSKQNLTERRQISFTSAIKLGNRWKVNLATARDLVLERTLSKSVMIYREGCCTTFGFAMTESNPSSLTKPQQTYSINLSFKNL